MNKKDLPNYAELRHGNLVTLKKQKDDEGKETDKKRFSMLAYTGAPFKMFGAKVAVNLDGISIRAQKNPILQNHNFNRIAGFSDKAEMTKDGLLLEGVLTQKTEAGREIADLASDGFAWQASVGLDIEEWKFVPEGESAELNGQSFDGPIDIINKSELIESSFVPLGADTNTEGVVLSAYRGESRRTGEEPMPKNDEGNTVSQKDLDDAKEQAKQDALKAERERHAELRSEFADDPDFALDQIEKGNDVLTAKAEYADKLKAQNAAQKEQIAKLEKGKGDTTSSGKGAEGAEAVGGFAGKDGGGEKPSFMQMSKDYAKEKGVKLHVAMSAVSREHPEVYAAHNPDHEMKQRNRGAGAGKTFTK